MGRHRSSTELGTTSRRPPRATQPSPSVCQRAPRRAAYFTPTLHRALAALPWRAAPKDTDPGSPRRHGRLESRTATVIDLEGTEVGTLFPGAARAMRVVRRRTDTATGVTSTETVYAIASLGHRYADAALLATWLRGHWQI